jgi:hypothetical protein
LAVVLTKDCGQQADQRLPVLFYPQVLNVVGVAAEAEEGFEAGEEAVFAEIKNAAFGGGWPGFAAVVEVEAEDEFHAIVLGKDSKLGLFGHRMLRCNQRWIFRQMLKFQMLTNIYAHIFGNPFLFFCNIAV